MEDDEIILSDDFVCYKETFLKYGLGGGLSESDCIRFCKFIFLISNDSSVCTDVDEIDLTDIDFTDGLNLLLAPESSDEALKYFNIAKPVMERVFIKYNARISELKVECNNIDTKVAQYRAELSNLRRKKEGIKSALDFYNSIIGEFGK